MKIEAGKFYRTRDGRKAGPIMKAPFPQFPHWVGELDGCKYSWNITGKYAQCDDTFVDLVAEWSDPAPSPDPVALIREMREALNDMLARDTLNTCQHNTTYRGGAIWTVCSECGAKWADDEGGKPKWRDPPEWICTEAAIAKADAYLAEVKPCD